MDLRHELLGVKEKYGFIPISEIRKLVTKEAVRSHLKSNYEEGSTWPESQISLSLKLITILILIGEETCLEQFLKQNISDEIFPVAESKVPVFQDTNKKHRFFVEQDIVPPIFRPSEQLCLPRTTTLPFISSQERIGSGSFGIVKRVKIANGHIENFQESYVAIKEIRYNDTSKLQAINKEIAMLRRRKHSNIVELLSSYILGDSESSEGSFSINLIFPSAEWDLESWMNLGQAPNGFAIKTRQQQRIALYQSVHDLVSALSYLHWDNTDDLNGCHHDIKPNNVLVFDGKWKLADFGHSRLFPSNEKSEADGMGGLGSYDYHPPEYYTDDGRSIRQGHGRAFDIWSMGCIMLQIATLIEYGWDHKKISEFRGKRLALSANQRRFKREVPEDASFHNSQEAVSHWLRLLQERASRDLHTYLEITIQMLRGHQRDRLMSWEVELDLCDLLNPDDSFDQRLKRTRDAVPKKMVSEEDTVRYTALNRAIARGNHVRKIALLESFTQIDTSRLQEVKANITYSCGEDTATTKSRNSLLAVSDIHVKEGHGFRLASDTLSYSHLPAVEQSSINCTGRNILKQDASGRSMLHDVVLRGDYQLIHKLSSHKDWEEALMLRDDRGRTPLHYACEKEETHDMAKLILTSSIAPHLVGEKDREGQIPVAIAVGGGVKRTAKLLYDVSWDESPLAKQEDSNKDTSRRLSSISTNSSDLELEF